MAGSDSAKGNPASHRMGNPHRKLRCERAHARTDKTKAKTKELVLEREKDNRVRLSNGHRKPWTIAKADRFARRQSKQIDFEKKNGFRFSEHPKTELVY